MAAYKRLQDLGEPKFKKILNYLMQGKSAESMALVIQEEWGECKDVVPKTLAEQLRRLRYSAAEGAFGKEIAEKISNGFTPHIKLLEGVTFGNLERFEELALLNRERVIRLIKKEQISCIDGFPSRDMVESTNSAVMAYRDLLLNIQKLRFDLGTDDFKGPLTTVRGASTSTTLPDGTNIQRQLVEATSVLESVFDTRGIRNVIDVDR